MFHDVQIDTSWSFPYFFKFAWKFKFSPVSSKIFSVESQSKRFLNIFNFFQNFHFFTKNDSLTHHEVFHMFSNLHEISNLDQFQARFSTQNHNRNDFLIFLTFFKFFIFSQKMSRDVQKWPQFNIVPDFSWVCRYDFWIIQILWCRKLAVSSKSLDEISQKSQKNLQPAVNRQPSFRREDS